jgi:serine protease Do
LAGELAVKPRSGVAVTKVMEGTPAAEAGLQEGDVIVRIAGQVVKTPQALQLAVERSPIGDRVELQVVRGGETIDLTYQAAEMETPNS